MTTLQEVLRGGRQCDEDGQEIIMSRQACCEAADEIDALRAKLNSELDKRESTIRKNGELIQENQDLRAHVAELEALVRAVETDHYDGIYCCDVGGKNWFDVRNSVLNR